MTTLGVDPDRFVLTTSDETKKGGKVEAIEFHRNFKPALILFNSRPESDHLREDEFSILLELLTQRLRELVTAMKAWRVVISKSNS